MTTHVFRAYCCLLPPPALTLPAAAQLTTTMHHRSTQDIPCSSGGDCVVFVDRFERFHIPAIIWFAGVFALGLAWRLGRRASPLFERLAAQARPLWRLAPVSALSSFSDLCFADLFLVAFTLGLYLAFVVTAANDRENFSDGGQAAGRLAGFMLSVTLLPVSRNSLYLLVLRIPFDRAIRFHRWNARLLTVVFLAHGGRMMVQNGWRVLGEREVNGAGYGSCFGTAAACCFLAMGVLAIDPIRRGMWELFKVSHMARRRLFCLPSSLPPQTVSTRQQRGRTESPSIRVPSLRAFSDTPSLRPAPLRPCDASTQTGALPRRHRPRLPPRDKLHGPPGPPVPHPLGRGPRLARLERQEGLPGGAQCGCRVCHARRRARQGRRAVEAGAVGVPFVRGRACRGEVGAAPVLARRHAARRAALLGELQRPCSSVLSRARGELCFCLRGPLATGPNFCRWPSPVRPAPQHTDFEGDLEFVISATGAQGSFTRRLRQHAAAQEGPAAAGGAVACARVWVDGPYGELGLRPEDYRVVVLISGGIGVTPMARSPPAPSIFSRSPFPSLSFTLRSVLCTRADLGRAQH